jgi:hypothetical protein
MTIDRFKALLNTKIDEANQNIAELEKLRIVGQRVFGYDAVYYEETQINTAKSLSRTAPKEQAHFLDIAYGSLMETDCQLDISLDLGYISREMREMLDVEINSIGKMIRSLKSHLQ